MDAKLRNLTLEHVEVDEIWTFVLKKQARLTVEEKAECHDMGDVYLWTCVDKETKLVPSFLVGKRSADNARKLMMDLRGRVVMPKPHQSDHHAFQIGSFVRITQLSTDGFQGYPEAVYLAFGLRPDHQGLPQRGAARPLRPAGNGRERAEPDFRHERGRDFHDMHVERHNLTICT